MLARKALRIREGIKGHNHPSTVVIMSTLFNILKIKRGNCDEERKDLLQQALAIYTKATDGDDSEYVRSANKKLAEFYCDLASALPPGDDKRIEQGQIA
jgi:hypothetical protein